MAAPAAPKSFQMIVSEGGNPRQMSISHYPLEMKQCVLDVVTWLSDHAAGLNLGEKSGLSPEGLAALETELGRKLPDIVQGFLLAVNGGVYFYEYTQLSDAGILGAIKKWSGSETWDPRFVPIAVDVDNNYLGVLYTESKDSEHEQVTAEWCSEEGLEAHTETPATYMETFRNQLCSHHLEYIEEVGLVQRVVKSPSKK